MYLTTNKIEALRILFKTYPSISLIWLSAEYRKPPLKAAIFSKLVTFIAQIYEIGYDNLNYIYNLTLEPAF